MMLLLRTRAGLAWCSAAVFECLHFGLAWLLTRSYSISQSYSFIVNAASTRGCLVKMHRCGVGDILGTEGECCPRRVPRDTPFLVHAAQKSHHGFLLPLRTLPRARARVSSLPQSFILAKSHMPPPFPLIAPHPCPQAQEPPNTSPPAPS